jgi:hypothetical protein
MPARRADAPLAAPFPWFGGKTKVATEVWARFGDVDNYVEPFGGSLAVLLARPDSHQWWLRRETAGDYAGHVVNFFRAVAADPDLVAHHAAWPVTEADLTARHLHLVRYEPALAEQLATDPLHFDARAAGWWVWGISAWVGGDWMSGKGPWRPGDPGGPGVYRKMPMAAGSHGGKGIHRPLKSVSYDGQRTPDVSDTYLEDLRTTFSRLSNRLRRVRLLCGDWTRTTGAVLDPGKGKIAAILLDPPYDMTLRRGELYGAADVAAGGPQIHEQARDWALSNGSNPQLRIGYCSYSTPTEDALFETAGWSPLRWSASGGYGQQAHNQARSNRDREVIWFSPACLDVAQAAAASVELDLDAAA